MGVEDQLADILNKYIPRKNTSDIRKQIEDWNIKVSTKEDYVCLVRTKNNNVIANYGFKYTIAPDSIIFDNYHIFCEKGEGTPSLELIEKIFSIIAKKRSTSVRSVFSLYKEQRVENWLKKKGYSLKDGLYEKIISSEAHDCI